MNIPKTMILASLLSSMSIMFCMQNENSLDGTLMSGDDWINLVVQGGKEDRVQRF